MAWRDLYPFPSQWCELPAARMHYIDAGSGRPVLMVHGNPTWSFYWRNLVAGVQDRARAVAVDHIGCGLSDKPQQYRYTLQQHTDNLQALIQRLDLRDAVLVAHDWGGAIGLGAAVREPDRFRGVVLLNTGAFPPPYVPWRLRACRLPVFGKVAIRGFNAFARAALTMAVGGERLPRDVRDGLLAPYDCWGNRIAVLRFVQDIPLTRKHATWRVLEELEQSLPKLAQLETRLVWGMKDWCFNETCLLRLQAAFPKAQSVRLPQAGHYVMEDAPQAVADVVRELLDSLASQPTQASPENLVP